MEKIERKQTAFRLRIDLLEKIKKNAANENTSINNYVETLLLDALHEEPNEVTSDTKREVESSTEPRTLDIEEFDKAMDTLRKFLFSQE